MQYSGARILIETLIELGVNTVFGYPGSSVLHIYDELYRQRKRIKHILVSHEQHAAHAADGYARSTGKCGVCIATSGPGATNLITGIAAAYMDSVPLIAITGNVPTALLGKDSFQEVDIAGVSMPLVKHNYIVKDIKELSFTVREAFIVAKSGRPGPVLIDIPKDLTSTKCTWHKEGDFLSARRKRLFNKFKQKTFSREDIEKAAALLSLSKKPLILAGGGIVRANAGAELKKLAEHINAPVALSLMGIGALPSNHLLCTGLIGMHGTLASNKAAQNTDLLIALGTRFSDRVICKASMFAKTAKVIHFDIDEAEINKNIETHAFVMGNLKESLKALNAMLSPRIESSWNIQITKWKEHRDANKTESTFNPRFIINETSKILGSNTIALTDVGQHQIWAAQYFPALKPRSFISSGGLGAMGFGLGAALGAKLANPVKNVVLFTGDGCFRMNSAELSTLKAYNIPILIVLFNNGVLGMIRQWQNYFHEGRLSESKLSPCPDYLKLCDAYGIKGFRADSVKSFKTALLSARGELKNNRAVLLEVCIDADEKVLPMVPSGKPIDEQIIN